MKAIYFILLCAICFVGCNSESENQVDEQIGSGKNQILGPNEAFLYSVPAPTMVSYILKTYGNNIYESKLLDDTKSIEPQIGISSGQTLNLGIFIIDFNYCYIFDQRQLSLVYLSKMERIMSNLNMQSPEIHLALVRLRENINNNDSVKAIINDYQAKLGNYYIDEDMEPLGLYVLSGMYVEGLYLTLGSYKNIIKSKPNINLHDDRFAQLLLQEETQLNNLLDLWKDKNDPESAKIIDKLTTLKTSFDALKISYATHPKTNKIVRINFDRSKLDSMIGAIEKIRKEVINN